MYGDLVNSSSWGLFVSVCGCTYFYQPLQTIIVGEYDGKQGYGP